MFFAFVVRFLHAHLDGSYEHRFLAMYLSAQAASREPSAIQASLFVRVLLPPWSDCALGLCVYQSVRPPPSFSASCDTSSWPGSWRGNESTCVDRKQNKKERESPTFACLSCFRTLFRAPYVGCGLLVYEKEHMSSNRHYKNTNKQHE